MHPRYGRNKNCAKTCFGPSYSVVDQSAMSHVFHWYLPFPLVLEFSAVLDDRCFPSADCLEEYLSGRLPALRCQSVCLSGFYLRLCLPC
ncbi:hypothetical protein ATANTOWER_026319 [Ataeniobius toweri]|uniref:Uncharacterized protein n=1 Tax=Ataeniobius toweri TaxID=208326 RepID=A0ABU7C163_9TELE|nr:hypothetical protein [Ataeniobius toweri]